MRRLVIVSALGLGGGIGVSPRAKEPIAPARHGFVPCRRPACIEITGQPIKEVVFTPGGVPAKVDPNGKYQVEQMYVQYFLPQNRKGKLPLLLWHGGGLTGVTYETKPDGGDGWLTYFIRKGWDIYISDAVERGRSGWTNTFKGEAGGRCRWAIHGSAFASARPARGTTTRPSARPIRARNFRSRPTSSS